MKTNGLVVKNHYFPCLKILKYTEVLKISFLTNTTYFASNLAGGLIVFLRIWIFTQLYQIAFQSINTHQLSGFTIPMVVWSLMLVQSISSSVRPSVARQIQDEIKDGTISLKISRPYSFMFFYYFELLGRFFSNIAINLVVGILAVLILVGPIHLEVKGLIFGTVLLFTGLFIDFLIAYSIGLLSFWLEDIIPIIWIYSKGIFVLGGMIFPIALFPQSFQKVAELLPFSQLFYAAARTYIAFDIHIFLRYLFTQICWIIFFYLLAILIFKKGIKNVNINGG